MKTITATDIKDILARHKMWINGNPLGERADLRYANLSNADLRNANLSNADLRVADLSNANLRVADLRNANLRVADLRNADLSNANLRVADLRYADLRYANLSNANLRYADLRYADLSNADLRVADLSNANLRYAKIERNVIDMFFPICCPSDGAFIGWKKCRDGLIVKLEICDTAKRSSAWGRKCRCSAAKVLAIYDGENEREEAHSIYNDDFVYRVGEIVSVEDFDDNRLNECSSGIHFFITRKEAEDYDD